MKNEKRITITTGQGPAECCWVAAQVLKIILKEAQSEGLKTEVISKVNGTENRTITSASISIAGTNANDFVQNWLGTIQWIGQSTFRKYHKRKNWFVAVIEQSTPDKVEIRKDQVSIQTMRSGGKGGQHVNKVNTAVRVTHHPTGITAVASDERSQLRNKKIAMFRLQEKIEVLNQQESLKEIEANWQKKIDIERGNPIRIFRGSDFKTQKQKKGYSQTRQRLKSETRKHYEHE
jgi:peptide chain release factor